MCYKVNIYNFANLKNTVRYMLKKKFLISKWVLDINAYDCKRLLCDSYFQAEKEKRSRDLFLMFKLKKSILV